MAEFFAVVIGISVLVFVLYPLGKSKKEQLPKVKGALADLLSEKQNLLEAVKELEFDLAGGKLSEKDYHELRQSYEIRAAKLLEEIDKMEKEIKNAQ